MSNELKKNTGSNEVQVSSVDLGVQNANVPSDYYSSSPCMIGLSYLRVMVDGNILPCCIAKHEIGSVLDKDWREIWHSGAYENFRKKMARIHVDRFHLVDPEWNFCQQCSHLLSNQRSAEMLKK